MERASLLVLVEAGQLAECVLKLELKDFYKSMTTLYDSKIWQDVYRPNIKAAAAYVKVQIVDDIRAFYFFIPTMIYCSHETNLHRLAQACSGRTH